LTTRGPSMDRNCRSSPESVAELPTAPAGLRRAGWGLTSWGRGPRSGGARAEGVNVDCALWMVAGQTPDNRAPTIMTNPDRLLSTKGIEQLDLELPRFPGR
jgi:hypothetical protein